MFCNLRVNFWSIRAAGELGWFCLSVDLNTEAQGSSPAAVLIEFYTWIQQRVETFPLCQLQQPGDMNKRLLWYKSKGWATLMFILEPVISADICEASVRSAAVALNSARSLTSLRPEGFWYFFLLALFSCCVTAAGDKISSVGPTVHSQQQLQHTEHLLVSMSWLF